MASYKGITITDTITALDGLNTQTDNALVLVDSVNVKLSKTVYNSYTINFTYKVYKNATKAGDPMNYKFTDLITSITGQTGDVHVTNTCYKQIGTYLTNNSINYTYVNI